MTEKQLNENTYTKANDEVSFREVILKIREWWRYILSKWRIVLLSGIIGGLIGLIYAYWVKPVFIAETTFVLEEESHIGGMGQLGGLVGLVGAESGGGGIFQGDNIFQLYRSKSMVEKTLLTKMSDDKQLLIERYIQFRNLLDQWKNKPEVIEIDFVKDKGVRIRDSIMIKIVNSIIDDHLIVSRPDKKLGIISVKIRSEDEKFSKEFGEKLVENVNQFYVETKTKKSFQSLNVLQKQTDSVRAVLNGAIFSASYATDNTPNINPSKQVLRVPVQRSQIDVDANKVILTELVKNLEMTKMTLRKAMPLIQIIDSPTYPLKIEKVRKLSCIFIGGLLGSILMTLFLIIRSLLNELIGDIVIPESKSF